MTDRTHLHGDDYPATLGLLAALVGGRAHHDWTTVGYESTEHGAWVDWDRLDAGWLSSTEKAVVHIAHGCAILENAGGPSPRLRVPLRTAIVDVTPDPHIPPGWGSDGDDQWPSRQKSTVSFPRTIAPLGAACDGSSAEGLGEHSTRGAPIH